MKNSIIIFFLVISGLIHAHLPKPDHIVIVIFQNKAYNQIVSSMNAPYINSLIADTNTALFTQSYALTHPSQPNYLLLYSGSSQGVTSDNVPTNTPFTTCNLGASLLISAHTFTGYSESMPSDGYLGNSTSLYYRKHNPWSNWQGTKTNGVPPEVNQPFTSFPSDYNELPDVSIVVPNIINCMHDGSIQDGDDWLKANLSDYIEWAKTHNSLLILTFDEDNNLNNNRILTFFLGPMVRGGIYNLQITHYNVLRTLEDIYQLPKCGGSANNQPIDFIWKEHPVETQLNENPDFIKNLNVWPVPSKGYLRVNLNSTISDEEISISLNDLSGKSTVKKKVNIVAGENIFDLYTTELNAGVYFLNISGKEFNLYKKITVE